MEPLSILVLGVMAVLAGIINSAVGSGSLLTLPVLMALGVPPGIAVRTNTIGMSFSSLGSVVGFRREIAAEHKYLWPLIVVTIVSATGGSLLLLFASRETLDFVVPLLIVVALGLVIMQPRLTKKRHPSSEAEGGCVGPAYLRPRLIVPMAAAAVYGGFFTAAQGVLYLAIMGVATGRSFKDVNPVKVYLSAYVNVAAAVVYVGAYLLGKAEIMWSGVVVIAIGGLIGGLVGSYIAKRLSNALLRGIIVIVALAALARELV